MHPVGKLVAALSEADRAALMDAVRAQVPAGPDGRIAYSARANAVKGRVPGYVGSEMRVLSCPGRAQPGSARAQPEVTRDLGATRADQRSRREGKSVPRSPGPRLALAREFVPHCGRWALAWPGHARQVRAVDPPRFAAIFRPLAPVAELVDAPDSKSGNGNIVLVRVRPGAPLRRSPSFAFVR